MQIKLKQGGKEDFACEVTSSFGAAGASQIHKGIPHLHSRVRWTEALSTGGSFSISVTGLISNLEIASVTTVVPFEIAGAASLFKLLTTKCIVSKQNNSFDTLVK